MSAQPFRTVEVILDTESEALLMNRGAEFSLTVVKNRFMEHIGPPITSELKARPGQKLLMFAARTVAGVIRLIRA